MRRIRVVGVLLTAMAAGTAGLVVPVVAVGATALSPCTTPLYDGHWSGTWTGPTQHGQWSDDITWSSDGTLVGTASSSRISGSTTTVLYSHLPISGAVSCNAATNVDHIDFGLIGSKQLYTAVLSVDGRSAVGTYSNPAGHGSITGTLQNPPGVTDGCTSTQTCDGTVSAKAFPSAPSQTFEVTGMPSAPTGTVQLHIKSGSLTCPGDTHTAEPVATLTDTGFAATDVLTVTIALHFTSAVSAAQVCFNSTIPYVSQSSPSLKKAGTAFLLDCSQTSNAAPCVVASTDAFVKFLVRGGDPRFHADDRNGGRIWLPTVPTGSVGKPYSAHPQSKGLKQPIAWKIQSGKLPGGLSVNASTGAITGKPTTKGHFNFVLQATDSTRPAHALKLTVPITIK